MSPMPASDQGVSPDRYHLIPRVLIFITRRREALLLKGAPTKRIWAGKYNGVGGHVERGEDFLSAARREIAEETGLTVAEVRLRGLVNINTGQPTGIGILIFTALAPEGEAVSGAEGALEWIPFERILELDLVEDLPTLLPKVLAMGDDDPPFFGHYSYDAGGRLRIVFAEG